MVALLVPRIARAERKGQGVGHLVIELAEQGLRFRRAVALVVIDAERQAVDQRVRVGIVGLVLDEVLAVGDLLVFIEIKGADDILQAVIAARLQLDFVGHRAVIAATGEAGIIGDRIVQRRLLCLGQRLPDR